MDHHSRDTVRIAETYVSYALDRGLEWTALKGRAWCMEHLDPSLNVLFRARPSSVHPHYLALGLELLGDLLTILEAYPSALRAYRRAQRTVPRCWRDVFSDDIALGCQMAGKPLQARREVAESLRASVHRSASPRATASFPLPPVEADTVWRGAVVEDILFGRAERAVAQAEHLPLEEGWDLRLAACAVLGDETMVYRILHKLQRARTPVWISPLVPFVLPDSLLDSGAFWTGLRDCAVTDCPALVLREGGLGADIGLDDAEPFARAMLEIHIARTTPDLALMETLLTRHPRSSALKAMHRFWMLRQRPPTWHESLD